MTMRKKSAAYFLALMASSGIAFAGGDKTSGDTSGNAGIGSSTPAQETTNQPNLPEHLTSAPGIGSAQDGTGVGSGEPGEIGDAAMIRRSAVGTSGTTSGIINAPAANVEADSPGVPIDTEKAPAGAIDENFQSSGAGETSGASESTGASATSQQEMTSGAVGEVGTSDANTSPAEVSGSDLSESMSGNGSSSGASGASETSGTSGSTGSSDSTGSGMTSQQDATSGASGTSGTSGETGTSDANTSPAEVSGSDLSESWPGDGNSSGASGSSETSGASGSTDSSDKSGHKK
jgi:collagen type VII alpha